MRTGRTHPAARGMRIDPSTGRCFLPPWRDGELGRIVPESDNRDRLFSLSQKWRIKGKSMR